MDNALASREYLPADYKYYQDLKDYYYPIRISLWKRVVAALIVKFSLSMMRDLGPEATSYGQEIKEDYN